MSQVVVHGGIVYLSGQIAAGNTIEEQTQAIFGAIESLLAEAGSSKGSMLSTTVWLTDMAEFGKFNTMWEAWLEGVVPPARAATQAALAAPQYLIEIAVIAACD
jgi:enamine deaminase RidA (YjgF/YER057c/UK114 family)